MKVPKSLLATVLCLGGPLASNLVGAASPFSADVTINGIPYTGVPYSSSDALFNALSTSSLQALNPNPPYDPFQPVQISGHYRGVGLSYAANGASVFLDIPSLGIVSDFIAGATRDENAQAMYDYLKSSGLLSQLSQTLARTSPTDPIAGNPNSLMSTMVAADFEQSFTADFSNIGGPETAIATGTSANKLTRVGIGLEYGQMTQGDTDVSNLTVPLSYSIRNDLDPRRQLLLRMPISIVDVDGAKAYHLGFGASYRFPMSQYWTLAPSINYAFTAATDLGSTAQMAATGLTSTYYWRKPGYDVGIGNMLSFATTLPFSYGGYDYDPHISNTVLRNGVMWSRPTLVSGRKMYFETSLIDTRFFGSKLYADNYQELRFSLGTARSAKATSVFRAGLALRHMTSDNGFNVEFGYWL